MNEEFTNNDAVIETIEPLTQAEAMSGVISDPFNTFDTIGKSGKKNYWLLPTLILVIVSVIASFIFLSNAELVDKVMDKQYKKVEKKMEESVKNGKMSREDANIALEKTKSFMNPKSAFFMITSYGGPFLFVFFRLFLTASLLMLLLKILKGDYTFENILNVVGLAFLISAVGKILEIVLSVVMGDMVNISLGLIFKEESVGSFLNNLLSFFDVFTIWFYAVVSIGLAKIGKVKTTSVVIPVFAAMLIISLVISLFA